MSTVDRLDTPVTLAPPGETPRPDRKATILLAAEKLFAQSGYHAVSLRQIAAEARVPVALVGYYYGSKQDLFHAIFAHWSPTIELRLKRLREVLASEEPCALRQIARTFVEPVLALRASPEGEYYAMLVARELGYRTAGVERVLVDYFDPMAHAFIDALCTARPHCSRAQAAWAYQFALGALLHHLVDIRVERLSHGQNFPNDPAAAPLLIDFITAGLGAALQAEPPQLPTQEDSR